MKTEATGAIDLLMKLLAVEGVTGQEKKIAQAIVGELKAAGVTSKQIQYDDANTRIPLPTQTGNLIVTLPGTIAADRILFMTHMDTVPLCAGAVPVRKGNKIVPEGTTALGGDNRTGCAVLINLVRTLLQHKLPHPPITLLFTVREESGLFGARFLDPKSLGGPVMGFNVDGRDPNEITVGAVGADRWEVSITGKASHAGVYPEKGISATVIASLALAEIYSGGWFGKVEKNGRSGTSNVGSFGNPAGQSAGNATNVVTDQVHITGECRSHDSKFFREITAAYKSAFERACKIVTDDTGKTGKVKFTSRTDYHPFRLKDDAPVVLRAKAAIEAMGMTAVCRTTNGGLDANWIVKHGLPTITFGAGQNDIHTIKEWVDLPLFLKGCDLAIQIATAQ
ncbi:MAG: M20/M25/M40 family metallo-hydrolase [Zavarzinella sp.]